MAALYRQIRTEEHGNIAQAQAVSRAAADVEDLASSKEQASYFLCQKSKGFYRDSKVATDFKASLPEGTDLNKALSIIRHKASPTCMGAAVALAKSLTRLDRPGDSLTANHQAPSGRDDNFKRRASHTFKNKLC